ncbi:MAG: DNA replication and repair protein RecF, partial [Bacilli bacterium]|nr:DNA replication and repair protein RecF [Bacilli bacterium]
LNDYNNLLKIRNDYLIQLSNEKDIDEAYFNVLTDYIVEKSVFIHQMRDKYIHKLNNICPKIFKDITKKEDFLIKYLPSIEFENMEKETIRKKLKEVFHNNIQKEIKQKTTLYGPHKDDFEFHLKGENLRFYGSQGQQRIAVLALKLSEIQILKDYKNENPIILLDDVFSELDPQKKNNLLSYIDSGMQVIITTTDLDNIDNKIIKNAKLINIEQGKIQKEVK